MPVDRITHSAGVLNNKVIVAGGSDFKFISLKRTDIYNLAENKWLSGPSAIYKHLAGAGATVDQKFVICGGILV